jgi:hypothetical protein
MTEELAERMVLFFDQVPKNKWYYFHKKSVDNFIYHLPNISNESKRAEIADKIKAYLTEIEAWPLIDIYESDISTCEYLYHTHVKTLSDFYDLNLGFFPVISTKVKMGVIVALAVMFYLFRDNKIVITILIVINILYWGRIIYKARERKLYGFAY